MADTEWVNGIILSATRDGQKTRLRLEFVTLALEEQALFYYDLDYPAVGANVPIAQHYGDFLPLLDSCLAQGHHSWVAAERDYRIERKGVERLWDYAVKAGVIVDDGRLWAPVKPQALSRPSGLAERVAW